MSNLTKDDFNIVPRILILDYDEATRLLKEGDIVLFHLRKRNGVRTYKLITFINMTMNDRIFHSMVRGELDGSGALLREDFISCLVFRKGSINSSIKISYKGGKLNG